MSKGGGPKGEWRCATCAFLSNPRRAGFGQCRRYAPRWMDGAEVDREPWPEVALDEWCGDWKDALS